MQLAFLGSAFEFHRETGRDARLAKGGRNRKGTAKRTASDHMDDHILKSIRESYDRLAEECAR